MGHVQEADISTFAHEVLRIGQSHGLSTLACKRIATEAAAVLCGLKRGALLDGLSSARRRGKCDGDALAERAMQAVTGALGHEARLTVAKVEGAPLLLGEGFPGSNQGVEFVELGGARRASREEWERHCESARSAVVRDGERAWEHAQSRLDQASVAPPTFCGYCIGYPAVYALPNDSDVCRQAAGDLSERTSVTREVCAHFKPLDFNATIMSFSVPQFADSDSLEEATERLVRRLIAQAARYPAVWGRPSMGKSFFRCGGIQL